MINKNQMKKKIKENKKKLEKKKKEAGAKPLKLEINFNYQKILKLTLVASVLLLSFSVFYYHVLLMPAIERERLEQQKELEQLKINQSVIENKAKNETESKQKEESQGLVLTNCLNTAKEAYFEVFKKAMEDCDKKTSSKDKYDCASSLLDDIQKGLQEAQGACLNINQENDGLNIINP